MISEIWKFDLRRGSSDDPRNGACLLDAVSWFEYGTLGDHPLCVCPVIASYARGVNDMLPDDKRQTLKPLILRLPGTVDRSAEKERAKFLMWQAIRVFAPIALESAASSVIASYAMELRRHAAELRGIYDANDAANAANAAASAASKAHAANNVDKAVAHIGNAANAANNVVKSVTHAANHAASAAAYASNAVKAVAHVADSAYAANNIVKAVAHAAHAASAADHAAHAADHAAYAAKASAYTANAVVHDAAYDAAAAEIYDLAIAALNGVLRIGKQATPISSAAIEAANRSFEMAALG